MLEGTGVWIIVEFIPSALTVIALCSSIEGCFVTELNGPERVLLFVGAVCELHTSVMVKLFSNLLIAIILLKNIRQKKQ